MAVARQELPDVFRDTGTSRKLFRRTQAVQEIEPLVAQRIEDREILRASPVKEAVVAFAPSLKRARVSFSETNTDPNNPMTLLVSFEPKLSLRQMEIAWKV